MKGGKIYTVSIGKIRIRAGENLNQVWSLVRQRTNLFGSPNRIRAGDTQPFDELLSMRSHSIEIPKMTIIPGMSDKAIMTGEVTIGLFKRVMLGYTIIGHNADKLKEILNSSVQENKALTYVSLFDAREFADRLSVLTDRNFRVQTESEWIKARLQLTGSNWTWTETKYVDGTHVLRILNENYRGFHFPETRYNFTAIRLVEDLK